MTEQEWLTSEDPIAMLDFLTRTPHSHRPAEMIWPFTPSDRKMRLFACACCRQMQDKMSKRDLRFVAAAENYADGRATKKQFDWEHNHFDERNRDRHSKTWLLTIRCFWSGRYIAEGVAQTLPYLSAIAQVAILREIMGNPWKSPTHQRINGLLCPLSDSWQGLATEIKPVSWSMNPTVLNMAQSIYEENDWEAMPILADALEDAECNDEEMLKHLRGEKLCPINYGKGFHKSPDCFPSIKWECETCHGKEWIPLWQPHVRGCHILDLILGKE